VWSLPWRYSIAWLPGAQCCGWRSDLDGCYDVPVRTTVSLLFLLALCPSLGCGGNKGEEQPTTLLRGDRQRPRALKASDNRPHPWTAGHGVFESDRLDLQPYMARRRAVHREEHSKLLLLLERFSHPACSGLSQAARRGCTILATQWRRREVAGGVALVASEQAVAPADLHRRVQCHVAFGKVHGFPDEQGTHQGSGGCPLHTPGARITTARRRGEVLLTIVTDDPAAVGPLRERVKELIP